MVGLALFAGAAYIQTPTITPVPWWPMFRHDTRHTGLNTVNGPRTIALAWSYRTGDRVSSSPGVDSAGNISVGSQANKLYALGPSGGLAWSYTMAGDVDSSPAISEGGRIYAGSRGSDDVLYALNSTGKLAWSYGTLQSSAALGADGSVYVGSSDNKLYAFDSSGSRLWTYSAAGAVDSSPSIGSDGRLYVGSNDNNLYVLAEPTHG